jgi:putative copper export protein
VTVLSPTVATLRLFLHVLAAAIWVGGQFALAGVVGTVRSEAPGATRLVARAFARLAWPAYAVLVVTGVWNLVAIDVAATSTAYQITVFVKILVALVAATATAVHSIGRSKAALAIGGAVGALASVLALFLGVLLRTGTG